MQGDSEQAKAPLHRKVRGIFISKYLRKEASGRVAFGAKVVYVLS
jgi:hypothetical protein